ncbi:hypothetical protein J008_05032 [Cryptococcus neoformans]|nr:hypothetical protein C362_04558 [Cryptococcus neoformans var. grubii Bt1]OXC63464.1 hypothetical protein AYX13_06719 [Cryptococcus neoformans var. grubii]OXG18151.1 hypothetical protein C367_04968 [Cryptococcus neoformans var. grubii Ze90-1]OXH26619.1 hypothetical protein J008_05032 [Cryptococcus neoformans var. grubii]
MSTASSESFFPKDRKRSAHWSDSDTDILVDVLLRERDTGRTVDNGFKPEVWKEAARLLENSNFVGGPKTPEACRSRWQRLQRDYRLAKEMEVLPGFSWDHNTHRLSASPEAWMNAEKEMDAYKYRKIHLPHYDSLAILCANDSCRRAPRNTKTRHTSISSSSSLMNLSTPNPNTSTPAQMAQVPQPITMTQVGHLSRQHSHSSLPPNGQMTPMSSSQHHPHGHPSMHDPGSGNGLVQLGGTTLQTDHNVFSWESGEQGGGERDFDGSFGLSNGSQAFLPQKRTMPFDPSLLNGSSQQHHMIPQGSPPKKPRTSSRPMITHQLSGMHQNGPFGYSMQNTGNPAHLDTGNPGHGPNAGSGNQGDQHSPEFSTSTPAMLDHTLLQTPPGLRIKPYTPPTPGSAPNLTLQAPEMTVAGLTEAQRRTEALLQLQLQESEMRDEDMVEVMAEFEVNVAAADTYLAIKREPLRKMWLANLVKRRNL